MLFGIKNSPPSFQRLINVLISDLDGCKAYIDDAIIISDEWEHHHTKKSHQLSFAGRYFHFSFYRLENLHADRAINYTLKEIPSHCD